MYSQEIYTSRELKTQLQEILDSCKLQKNEINVVKDLLNDISNKNPNPNIGEKINGALATLSAIVTLSTADYSKIIKLPEILINLIEKLGG